MSLQKELNKFSQEQKVAIENQKLQAIVNALKEDPEIRDLVYDLIQGGVLKQKLTETTNDKYHKSAYRFRDLSKAAFIAIMQFSEPTFNVVAMKMADNVKKGDLKAAFYFAFMVSSETFLPSKYVEVTKEAMKQRYFQAGKRLQNMVFNPETGQLDWQKSGAFTIDVEQQLIRHISGCSKKIIEGQCLDASSYIKRNVIEQEAVLVLAGGVQLSLVEYMDGCIPAPLGNMAVIQPPAEDHHDAAPVIPRPIQPVSETDSPPVKRKKLGHVGVRL